LFPAYINFFSETQIFYIANFPFFFCRISLLHYEFIPYSWEINAAGQIISHLHALFALVVGIVSDLILFQISAAWWLHKFG
jgi:hypothetical protein